MTPGSSSVVDPSCVALVPARAGSKRVPGKNRRVLADHPLLAYSVAAALESGVFGAVVVSTDSEEIAEIARHYGGETPFLRPAPMAGDRSPDIEWVGHALETLAAAGRSFDAFSILRPTSPFRKAATIRRAWAQFLEAGDVDSLRAVERCAQHPAKMWRLEAGRLVPLLPSPEGVPYHSRPYHDLPEVWVQNASLEIAWTSVVREQGAIAGKRILAFRGDAQEGFDINRPEDWIVAEHRLASGEWTLPVVETPPWRARTDT